MRPSLHAALLSMVLLTPAFAVVSHAASLAIAPAETTITVGDPVTLRVVIDAVPDLKGAELVYGYTANRIAFTGAQAGDAMTGLGGSTFAFVLPDVAAPADTASFDVVRLDGTGSGPGVVAFLHFDSFTQGNASVNCLLSDLRDTGNTALPVACAGALVHVIGPVPVRPASWGRLKQLYR